MKWKNNLDERQEQLLLKIEHNALWLTFGLLFLDILIMPFMTRQTAIFTTTGVFLVSCCFMLVACMRHGIFDRHFKMNWQTNFFTALITGMLMMLVETVQNHQRYATNWGHAALAGIFTGIFSGILVFILGIIVVRVTKAQQRRLEQEPQDKD